MGLVLPGPCSQDAVISLLTCSGMRLMCESAVMLLHRGLILSLLTTPRQLALKPPVLVACC